ncbi:hypothetical protein ACHAWO_008975 [Cyclotella atomus]|uniref:EF-hand domain-containing protein n=1 Tax=Cyclotella atomus TaxID=382360 RepID=A0ABD3NEI9_9STRA
MENLLSEISCSHDANSVSMTQFMQLCLPHQTCSARELKHKLSFVFSECLLGLTWLHQVIESCREKDTQQSGLIGWQEFLEILDDTTVLLTASEANQLASLLADKVSFVRVKYMGLRDFV